MDSDGFDQHDDEPGYTHEPPRSGWQTCRERLWQRTNIGAAVALGAYIAFFHWDDVYDRLTSFRLVFGGLLVGLIGAIPLIRHLDKSKRPILGIWAVFATILLGAAALRAGSDAFFYNHSNCWTIRESGDPDKGGRTEVMECAPGDNEPVQGQWWNNASETGNSRFCDWIDETSSGGTIWRCREENL